MNELKEQYYKEDFKCFRHYVISVNGYIQSIDKKIAKLVGIATFYDKKYFTTNGVVYAKEENVYKDVMIFDEIPDIDLTRFYWEKNKPSYSTRLQYFIHPSFSKIDFIKRKKDRQPNNFHFLKLNRNWKIKNISKEKSITTIDGKTIYYRLADITILPEDNKYIKD